jgi:3-deoxy-D-manno-octulosonic-acid transferase
MMRAAYSLLMWLAQPLLRRKLARRAKAEPRYAHAVAERFGHYTSAPASGGERFVWVHAVSLGETRAAAVLLTQLRQQLPGMRLLLTHGTATGWEEGGKLLHPGDAQTWLPWDTPGATRRFLAHFKPAVGILMETEIWPNLVAQCNRMGVPLVLANARMSEQSLRSALRLGWLSRPAYRALRLVLAQSQADAQRLSELGATVQGVVGNLKFDASPDPAQVRAGRDMRQGLGGLPVVMLAVSREGEELLFLQALREMEVDARGVQWLIVPRHPQRFDEVATLVASQGFSVSRRSQWTQQPAGAQVWLGDTLGEMAFYYSLADVALLGGSFAPLGGQNLIEAAACACPVVMGPHTFNFSEAARLAHQAHAAMRVEDMPHGVQTAIDLLKDAPRLQAMRAAALAYAGAHRGAALKTAQAVVQLLASPSGDLFGQ